jgi:hypothetical protein
MLLDPHSHVGLILPSECVMPNVFERLRDTLTTSRSGFSLAFSATSPLCPFAAFAVLQAITHSSVMRKMVRGALKFRFLFGIV